MSTRLWSAVIQYVFLTIFAAPTFPAVASIQICSSIDTLASSNTRFALAIINVNFTQGPRPSTRTRALEFNLHDNVRWLDSQVSALAIFANITGAVVHWFRAQLAHQNFFCVGTRSASHKGIEYQPGGVIATSWLRSLGLGARCNILQFKMHRGCVAFARIRDSAPTSIEAGFAFSRWDNSIGLNSCC